MNTATATDPRKMTCLCGTTHTFAADETFGECSKCGLGLWLNEMVVEGGDEGGDEEPADIDDDSFTNPYTGAAEDDGYDGGWFDEGPGGCFDD